MSCLGSAFPRPSDVQEGHNGSNTPFFMSNPAVFRLFLSDADNSDATHTVTIAFSVIPDDSLLSLADLTEISERIYSLEYKMEEMMVAMVVRWTDVLMADRACLKALSGMPAC